MRRTTSLAALCGAVLSAAVLLASPLAVAAHESRTIADGKYEIVVGFMNEPVFAGDKSGLEFWVTETPATPIEGLAETLQAEVIYEDQTMALPLTAKWDEPGGYYSVFFPTAAEGDYTFRIYGTIDGTEIDETFTSGPETFGPVEDPAPLRFPSS
jgi:hypothetical protein